MKSTTLTNVLECYYKDQIWTKGDFCTDNILHVNTSVGNTVQLTLKKLN